MLKKTITYTDFNGTEKTRDFYFNLTTSELMELELGEAGGLTATVESIIAAQDRPALIKTFKKLILGAYGEKSPDGERFVKSEEISNAFSQTKAYDKLFLELIADSKASSDFVNGILPANLSDEVKALEAKK